MPEKDPPQTSEDLAIVLKELEQRTERLKQLYEQYFMGIERMEPMVARKEVTRSMLALQQQYIRNTALRFKFNTMAQKWSLYTTYWNRTMREIDKGTYVRHLQKAARNAERNGRVLPSEMRARLKEEPTPAPARPSARNADSDIDDALGFLQAPAAPRPPTPAAGVPTSSRPPPPPGARGMLPPPIPGSARIPTPPQGVAVPAGTPPGGVTIRMTPPQGMATLTPTPPQGTPRIATPPAGVPARPATPVAVYQVPGMSESELRALHRKYQAAKQASGDAAPVRYETLVASIAKQVPRVLEKPGVKGVRFDVEIKDGKPVLKAIPTK